jgi:hypothetical protein
MEVMIKYSALALLGIAATAVPHVLGPKDPKIDGRVLQGYESAVEFLRKDAEMRKVPFSIANYYVTFEKGYRYYFQVKAGPNYKPWPGLSTDLGTTVRVYVDPDTLKVKEGIVE